MTLGRVVFLLAFRPSAPPAIIPLRLAPVTPAPDGLVVPKTLAPLSVKDLAPGGRMDEPPGGANMAKWRLGGELVLIPFVGDGRTRVVVEVLEGPDFSIAKLLGPEIAVEAIGPLLRRDREENDLSPTVELRFNFLPSAGEVPTPSAIIPSRFLPIPPSSFVTELSPPPVVLMKPRLVLGLVGLGFASFSNASERVESEETGLERGKGIGLDGEPADAFHAGLGLDGELDLDFGC